MDSIVGAQAQTVRGITNQIRLLGLQSQTEQIHKLSPYSEQITPHIQQYEELQLYCSLHLRETVLTRPSLTREIDFDLWISADGCTNLELMKKGYAPYLFDAPDGKIELHHIGQEYAAPFAELTLSEHDENSQLLHASREESWRNDNALDKAFYKERAAYWKRRAKRDYAISPHLFDALPASCYQRKPEYTAQLRELCEAVYAQCEAEDLDYLSDLAKSYAMMHRIGAGSLGEFLKNKHEEHNTEISCAACRSSDYVLHGTYQTRGESIQRYKCRKCGKIFSPFHKSLVSGSSFSFREWLKFIDCLYNGYTVKQIAKTCDISQHTAQENRTKLFYALKLLNDKVQLKGNVVLDETYLPVSFKGNHTKQENFVMPRKANERSGENHQKGLSDHLVCIICAVDDDGNSVAKVAGLGASSAAKLKYVLQQHFSDDIYCLYSDKSPTIQKLATACNLEIKQEKLLRKGTQKATGVPNTKDTFVVNRYLQRINSYHSRLKKFLNRFSGISTKYLSGYLYLFAWKERTKDQEPEEAYQELLQIMTEPNHYLSVDDIINDGHIPDAAGINEAYRKRISIDIERDKEIYRRYAAGETMASIGKDYGITKQSVSLVVQKFRKNGMAYRTVHDIKREQKEQAIGQQPQYAIKKKYLDILERDYQIYAERQQWQGSSTAFKEKIAQEYGMSIYNVNKILAQIKRIEQLKSDIFIYEDISHRSLKEVYQSVYADYLALKAENPQLSNEACYKQLAHQFGFGFGNICRIVQIMEEDVNETYWNQKRKTPKTEIYNRDRALFIEYLRWPGTRPEFSKYAAQKYNLTRGTIVKIIRFCLYANPERCEMV